MTNTPPYAARMSIDTIDHQNAPILTGSSNVIINNYGAARVTDQITRHLPGGPHELSYINSGSSTVEINGLPAARVDDTTTCDGNIVTGSMTVIIGG